MKARLYSLFLAGLVALAGFTIATGAPLPAKGPAETAEQARNLLLRDSFRDHGTKIKADHAEEIVRWAHLFLEKRAPEITAASEGLARAGNEIRKARSLDATQLKADPEFRKLLTAKIKVILGPGRMKTDLRDWAEGVETQTRDRLIKCFQQAIAEDLGRSFDAHLKNLVVKAVSEIPVEQLVNNTHSSEEIEKTILASLPEAAIPETSRKWIKEAAVNLVKQAAAAAAAANGVEGLAAVVLEEAAGKLAGPLIEAGMQKINEELTPAPDPKAIQQAFNSALAAWNTTSITPRLEAILETYRSSVLRHLEDLARKQDTDLP